MTDDGEEIFESDPTAWPIHYRILRAFDGLSDIETRTSSTQVAYRHGRTFALVSRSGRSAPADVPLVLSLVLRDPLDSARVTEVVKVARDTWMHHLELRSAADVDDEVRAWIVRAWESADRRVGH